MAKSCSHGDSAPSSVRAVSLSRDLPRTLRGRNEVLALGNLNDFQIRDARSTAALESMYAESTDRVLNGTARETFAAIRLLQSIQVFGQWPGLEKEQLYQGRDLNVTTDFRSVLSELVAKQMGNPDVSQVFPGFRGTAHWSVLRT